MANIEIRLIIFFAAKDGEALYKSAKTRLGADCGSHHEFLIAKFRLKWKKMGITTWPFRYDLNQIPYIIQFSSVQFSRSVVSDSLRTHELQHSRPPCPSHLPEFTQTHVHRVGDAIQPSHPLLSPSPLAPNPSQHQSLFQWVNSSHEVAKVLEFQLQHHSLKRNPRADLLQNGLVGSPCSPRDSQESSPTPHSKAFFGALPSLQSNSHIHTWPLEKP